MRVFESMAPTLRSVVVFLAVFVAVETVSPHGLRPFSSRPQNGVRICTGAEMKARNGFSYFQHVRTCKIQGGKCCQPTDAGAFNTINAPPGATCVKCFTGPAVNGS